ncbi:DNA polymerase III alpha subunit [Roseomonas mucosa]|nr:DNA polymerase III alpha subunit [Roseomonas mucosa]
MATRIDRRAPGPVTVHGPLARDADGGLRIGALPVSPDAGIDVRPGGYVVASGPLSGGRMLARSVAADRLLTDLPASFGPGVGRFVVESYIGWDGSYLRPGYGLGPVAPPLQGGAAGRGVLDLRREPGRGIVATGLRNAPFDTGAGAGGRWACNPRPWGPAGVAAQPDRRRLVGLRARRGPRPSRWGQTMRGGRSLGAGPGARRPRREGPEPGCRPSGAGRPWPGRLISAGPGPRAEAGPGSGHAAGWGPRGKR